MARTYFAVLALALLCATAYAQQDGQQKVDPVANAAAGAIGKVVAPVFSGFTKNLVKPDAAAGRHLPCGVRCSFTLLHFGATGPLVLDSTFSNQLVQQATQARDTQPAIQQHSSS
jgi:hypothetical protein